MQHCTYQGNSKENLLKSSLKSFKYKNALVAFSEKVHVLTSPCTSAHPLYINPSSFLSLESRQHDSGRQFPVCWGRRRRYFLSVAACWTNCSAFAQSQEPRGQWRRPLLPEIWHKSIRLGMHALLYMLFCSSLILRWIGKETTANTHIEKSVFYIMTSPALIYSTEGIMTFPAFQFLQGFQLKECMLAHSITMK